MESDQSLSPVVERAMKRFHLQMEIFAFSLPAEERKRLARMTRQHSGIEVTPDQANLTLAKALANIRQKMVDAGHREFAAMTLDQVREIVRCS